MQNKGKESRNLKLQNHDLVYTPENDMPTAHDPGQIDEHCIASDCCQTRKFCIMGVMTAGAFESHTYDSAFSLGYPVRAQ